MFVASVAFPSTDQWFMAINGMRNPMNSWDKSDSKVYIPRAFLERITDDSCKSFRYCENIDSVGVCDYPAFRGETFLLGENDKKLAKNLIKSGPEHRKFLRQLPVTLEITAPLYWWKQMDTYEHTVTNSCSTMHKLVDKPFEVLDFSLADTINEDIIFGTDEEESIKLNNLIESEIGLLNVLRKLVEETGEKKYWTAINQLLPQSFNQRRTWSANYEVLFNICSQRANHKLSEWDTFVVWIINNVPDFKELCFDQLYRQSEGFRKLYRNIKEQEKERDKEEKEEDSN